MLYDNPYTQFFMSGIPIIPELTYVNYKTKKAEYRSKVDLSKIYSGRKDQLNHIINDLRSDRSIKTGHLQYEYPEYITSTSFMLSYLKNYNINLGDDLRDYYNHLKENEIKQRWWLIYDLNEYMEPRIATERQYIVDQIRGFRKMNRWKKKVKKGVTHCKFCGRRILNKRNLHAHHEPGLSDLVTMYRVYNPWDAVHIKALWYPENGCAICVQCHKLEHPYYAHKMIVYPEVNTNDSIVAREPEEPSNGCRNEIDNRWHSKTGDTWNIRESVKTVYYRDEQIWRK